MGLLTRNSEKNGSLVRFSSAKACSRPNWRRKPLCHSTGDRSGGAWVRESLGSFFAVVMETTLRRVDFIGLHLVQELPAVGRSAAFLRPLGRRSWNRNRAGIHQRHGRYAYDHHAAALHAYRDTSWSESVLSTMGSSSDMLGQTGFGGGLLISWAAYQAWSESRVHSRSLIVPRERGTPARGLRDGGKDSEPYDRAGSAAGPRNAGCLPPFAIVAPA